MQFHENVLLSSHPQACSYNRYQLQRVKGKMLPPGHMKPATASFLNAGRAASQSSISRSEGGKRCELMIGYMIDRGQSNRPDYQECT